MITDIIEDSAYKDLVQKQIYEIIDYLLINNEEFSVTANLDGLVFEPEIPDTIKKNFAKFTMFSLVNYTFSTVNLTENHISFEAGFGEENFGSKVTIPLFAIFQIIINESILFINPTATVEKYFLEQNNTDQKSRSRNAFLKHP
jgi:hypothetical protein